MNGKSCGDEGEKGKRVERIEMRRVKEWTEGRGIDVGLDRAEER